MVPTGEWVVETAARLAGEWQAAGLFVPVMGVNVSPYQLRGSDLPALVGSALARQFDRAFLDGVPEDPRRTRLLLAITGIAKALEMRTVAEGIERAGQLRAVGSMGFEIAQGFLLARPEPAAAIAARLAPAEPAPAVPA